MHHPILQVMETLSLWVKRPGLEANHSPPPTAKVPGSPSQLSHTPSWFVAYLGQEKRSFYSWV